MELDPADGLHKLHLELAVQDAEMGFGFDVLAFNEVSFPVFEPELESSTCGIGDRTRHFELSDFSELSGGDTVRYVHQPTGLVHCAGQCEPCTWPGCTDPVAENFNAEANLDDGSCNYPFAACDEIGEDGWADLPLGFYPGAIEATVGVDTTWQVVFNLPPLVSDDTGFQNQSLSFNAVSWEGWPPGAWGGDSVFDIPISGGTQSCIALHGFPTEAGTYTLTLTGTLVVSIFGSPFNIEGYAVPLEITVLESPDLNCFPFPDFGGASFAYEPDGVTTQLETAVVGASYADVLHVLWPTLASDIVPDTPVDAPIDSVLISSVSIVDISTGDTLELDAVGLTLDCAQAEESVPDCAFFGGEQACIALSGIPLIPGEFLLLVETEMWATVFGFPLATPFAFSEWPLTIVASGCTDPSAENYNPEANLDDGSCSYQSAGCEDIGDDGWADLAIGFHPGAIEATLGVDSTWQVAFNLPPLISDSNGFQLQSLSFNAVSWEGWPPGSWGGDLATDLTLSSGSQSCISLFGLPTETGTFTLTLTGTLVVSVFGSPFNIEGYSEALEITVIDNPNPILGCVYLGAENFSPIASIDDGSCIFSGCMDPTAINHSPLFNEEDDSCLYQDDILESECPTDLNGDDLIGLADLLVLLGEFGLICTP
jgi:hypothetical protein